MRCKRYSHILKGIFWPPSGHFLLVFWWQGLTKRSASTSFFTVLQSVTSQVKLESFVLTPKLAELSYAMDLKYRRATMAVQGHGFSEEEIQRIVSLLSGTDMTILEIASRMRCSRSAVASINRKWNIRIYDGLRSSWLRRSQSALLPSSADRRRDGVPFHAKARSNVDMR